MVKKEIDTGIRQQTHDKIDKIMNDAEQMSDNSKETVNNMKEKAKMLRENIDDRIRKKPEQTVLLATGIGVIIGAIVTAVLFKKRK